MGAIYLDPGRNWWEYDAEGYAPPAGIPAGPEAVSGLPGDAMDQYRQMLAQQAEQPEQTGGYGTLFGMGMRQIPAMAAAGGEWAMGQLSSTMGAPTAEVQDWGEQASRWFGESRQGWERAIAEKAKTLSPELQEARQKKWATSNTDEAAWADPQAIAAQFVESLPLTLSSMVPGGIVLRAGGGAIKGALVMGGIEGAMGLAETANNIASEISSASEQELMESPVYAGMREKGVSDADARATLLQQTQGVFAPVVGGLWSAAAGAAGGYGLGKLVDNPAGMGAIRRFFAGFGREAPTEALQGGGTQYLSAAAAQESWDPGRDVWGETLESGLQEGAIGGLSGGGFGLVVGKRPEAKPQPERRGADGTTDLTGNAGLTQDANQAAVAGHIPPPAAPPGGPTAAELAAAPDLATPEGRQAFIDSQAGATPAPAPATPAAAAAQPPAPVAPAAPAVAPEPIATPVVEAGQAAPTMPRFGNGGAQMLVMNLDPELKGEVLGILTATPPEGKKGYSQRSVNAAIAEARLRRRRLQTQERLNAPLPTEYGVEQGGQMRLPNFPLTPPEAANDEETEENYGPAPEQGWLPGMNPERNKAKLKVAGTRAGRTAPKAQLGFIAEESQGPASYVAPEPEVKQGVANQVLAERLAAEDAQPQRQLVSQMFTTLSQQVEGERAAEQRELYRALSQMALDGKRSPQVATALSYLSEQGKLPAGFLNQLTGRPKQQAAEKPAAKVAENDRDTLYQALADRDVTIKVDVNGKEAVVTLNAADALRDADLLVEALEEIKRVCV